MTFSRLLFWRDELPRSGPENMAIDEWLLGREREPLLRTYRWGGDWVSLGYFGVLQDARDSLCDRKAALVRRPTGGGMVDHRGDRTYTLVVPGREKLVGMNGAESYRAIHQALAAAMAHSGIENVLIAEDEEGDSARCFDKPVAWDILATDGQKIAGAAQRRTRRGLLHQGSVVVPEGSGDLFAALAERLAPEVKTIHREPSGEDLAALIEKFASRAWLERR